MTSILKVSEIQDPTNGNTALTIDSAGRVRMPVRPAFRAHLTSVTTFTGTTIIYDYVDFDIGGDYDATTGEFTAPVTGVYLVLWNGLLDSTANATNYNVHFLVNGVAIPCSTYETKVSGQAYTQMSNNALIQLSTGDVFKASSSGAIILFGNGSASADNQSHLSMCLMG
jgi:hypothetical protein